MQAGKKSQLGLIQLIKVLVCLHVINMIIGLEIYQKSLKILILCNYLGQLVQFKGMLIGIYKSREFFQTKHFGLVFSRNFTQSQIKQKIEDRQPMANDVSRSFHVAIVH